MDLSGVRVWVVGASSGIGAAVAGACTGMGAQVAVSARRADRLDQLVTDGVAALAAPCDVGDRSETLAAADRIGSVLGGIDLMIYVAGYGVLQRLVDTDPDVWADVYRVNVIGANVAAGAALAHMDRNGVRAFVSSRTTIDANAMFASYSASKAALDQCIRTWRVEHPDRRFVRVVMGNCQPTEFANQMNLELLGPALEAWGNQRIPGGMMHVDDVGLALARAMAVVVAHPEIDASELQLDARTA